MNNLRIFIANLVKLFTEDNQTVVIKHVTLLRTLIVFAAGRRSKP